MATEFGALRICGVRANQYKSALQPIETGGNVKNTPQNIYKYPREWESQVPLSEFPWPSEIIPKPAREDTNSAIQYLLTEQYLNRTKSVSFRTQVLLRIYYFLKPIVPRSVQLEIQRIIMRKNRKVKFPREPFEPLVADLLNFHLSNIAKKRNLERIPYIAFWPHGYEAAFCFTHDIEGKYGYEKLHQLVDLEKRHGIRSTINIVPERYKWDIRFLSSLAEEGFEIGLHGLNHDKQLFRTREIFDDRCRSIEKYAKQLNVAGFRSPSLQRYYPWMEDLPGIYDSSYPDVEVFSLFPGGCCHILPWFIDKNNKVELPVTMPQDHYLFNLLRESSIKTWSDKWRIIRKRGGLGCVIIHPDYMMNSLHRGKIEDLIDLVTSDPKVWVTTAANVANWWIERSATELVEKDGKYFIQGSKRAKLQFLEIADAKTA